MIIKTKNKRVTVVMGGWSVEREVSLSSAQGVIRALKEQGYETHAIDLTRDIPKFIKNLLDSRPDVVFMNALHGRWGEDGCLQGLLEMLNLPYTNSGVLASALAMDKAYARKVFKDAGLKCAEGFVTSWSEILKGQIMPTPYVIKPIYEGSSLGVHIITDESVLRSIYDHWEYEENVLVERYIPGREIQVAVLGDRAWGAIEICPHDSFYDYEAKYTEGKASHLMPASLNPETYAEVLELAKRAHDCLGCEGVTRVDFRYNDSADSSEKFYLLEVNTQPGMTPLSLVPEIVAHHGMSYGTLVEWMVEHPHDPGVTTSHLTKDICQTDFNGKQHEWTGENVQHCA
ncbi:MAG: D-alanine--D-alanine ligase [Janthinobacterium lividum]